MFMLTWGLIAVGFVLVGIAAFWNWFQVLEESAGDHKPGRGLFYLWQPYAIYYELVHRRSWPRIYVIYGILFLGFLCWAIAYVIGRKAGVLPP